VTMLVVFFVGVAIGFLASGLVTMVVVSLFVNVWPPETATQVTIKAQDGE
jgi:L-lactate permease